MIGVDALALWWLATIDTGGGASVGGNVDAGRDLVGRDRGDHRNQIDINFNDDYRQPHTSSLEERVTDLEQVIYGEKRWSEPGMIRRQQQQTMLTISNTLLLIVVIILMLSNYAGR